MRRFRSYATRVASFLLTLASILSIMPSGRAAWAQTGTISGRVVDQGGAGISYAEVLLKGTTMGGTADAKGNFRIVKIPVGTYGLVAREIGYATSEPAFVQVSANQTASVEFRLTTVPVRLRVGPEVVGTRKVRALDDGHVGTSREDSLALFGPWRWARSAGGNWEQTSLRRHPDGHACSIFAATEPFPTGSSTRYLSTCFEAASSEYIA